MYNPKSKTQNQNSGTRKRKPLTRWIVLFVIIIIATGLFYYIIYAKPKSQDTFKEGSIQTENAAALEKANQLTQEVFRYVELVETKKMTQAEADRLSGPVKAELQSLRMQLSQRQLAENDSIRKALGDIMVANVMKWRRENLPPVSEQ